MQRCQNQMSLLNCQAAGKVCWNKRYRHMKMKICHCHPVTKVWFYSICAGLWNCTPSPDVWQGDVIRNHKRELTSCMLVLVSLLAAVDNTCAPLSAVWSSWRIQSSPHSRCHTPGCRRWHCEHLCSANPATPTIRKQSGKKIKSNRCSGWPREFIAVLLSGWYWK